MSEKLTASITFKCTDEEKILLERIAKSRKLSLSELMRNAGIEIIREVQELLKSLQAEFDLTTDTRDMREPEPFDLELVPNPIRAVSPQKTTNWNQLSLNSPITTKQ